MNKKPRQTPKEETEPVEIEAHVSAGARRLLDTYRHKLVRKPRKPTSRKPKKRK